MTVTSGSGISTLQDLMAEMDPNGKPYRMANTLTKSSPIVRHMSMVESNEIGGRHKSLRLITLPTVYKRTFNQGTVPSKASSEQVEDQATMFVARSHIDLKQARVMGAAAGEARVRRGKPFLEAFTQAVAEQLIYGNPADDDAEFPGAAIRRNTLGDYCVSAGGSGNDNCSMYFFKWHPEKLYTTFPKGTSAGLQHEDLGIQQVQDANGIAGATYSALMDEWGWDLGLTDEDPRCLLRIGNIDISDAVALTGTQATSAATFLPRVINDVLDRFPEDDGGMLKIYAPRTLRSVLREMIKQYSPYMMDTKDFGGRPVTTIHGAECSILDALHYSEATVA